MHLLGQPGAAQALAELLDLVVLAALAELLLDGLHLLAEDVLALGLALVGHHRADLLLHAKELELPAHDRRARRARAPCGVEGLEDLLLVGDARLLGRQVRRDEVGQGAALAHVVEDARGLARAGSA